ncbi:MAG: sel1 repeat family protein [Desulfobulbaceae bacterium]
MSAFPDFCFAGTDSYVPQLQELAAQGDGESQFALAMLHEYGDQGVDRDPEKALSLFLQAGKSGIPAACLYLGIKYENGSNVVRDPAAAVHWYCCAAKEGWGMAQFFLAELYRKGKGVTLDNSLALAWYGLAEEQGYPGAKEAKTQLSGEMNDADKQRAASICSELQNSRGECPQL